MSASENSYILAPYGFNLVTSSLSDGDVFDNVVKSLSTSPVEESLHTPISQNITSGMRQLEDAAADV
jgi:hypothetical protein